MPYRTPCCPELCSPMCCGAPLAIGAFATGLLCALATGYIRANSRVKEDTVLGIVFAGLFALGIFLFTKIETDQHLTHVLFGNLLGTTPEEMALLLVIALPVLALLLVFRQTLMLYVFDPAQARALGFRVPLLHFGLLALLAATTVAALKAVGVILVVAMLVTPGAIGFLLARRFGAMMMIAWGTAVVRQHCRRFPELPFRHADGTADRHRAVRNLFAGSAAVVTHTSCAGLQIPAVWPNRPRCSTTRF